MALTENELSIRGFVGTQPELRTSSNGTVLASFRVAVPRPLSADRREANRRAGEKDPTDWFNVTMFRDLASSVVEKSGIHVGDLIAVKGSIHVMNRRNADSSWSTFVDVTANKLDILIRKAPATTEPRTEAEAEVEDSEDMPIPVAAGK